MKILVTTLGSHGDVQPFVALAKALKAAGHEVTICTLEGFRPFVEAHGVSYAHVNNEFFTLMQTPEGQSSIDGSGSKLELVRKAKAILRRVFDDEWQAAQTVQPELIIFHPKALGSAHIAEKLNIPAMMALPLPLYTPTSAFPNPMFGGMNLGGWLNRLSYWPMIYSTNMYAGIVNDFRVKGLGLRPRARLANPLMDGDGNPIPILYPYSPHLLPAPADYPPHVHVTGYWFLDQGNQWQPPAALAAFLDAGPPPVYVGFGSMGGAKAAERAEIVLGALDRAGQRGLLASGWGGLQPSDTPESVHLIESAPHDWLFPQVAAVVHRGGGGTTAAGLRAGKPTVICPFIGDQPFWGRVIHKQGLGPRPIPQQGLTVDGLAAAIMAAVGEPAIARRAAAMGEQIRAEDGLANAVEIIERNWPAGHRAQDAPSPYRTGGRGFMISTPQ